MKYHEALEKVNAHLSEAENAPLIVKVHAGELVATGTLRETEYYVRSYVKTGDPHRECPQSFNNSVKPLAALTRALRTLRLVAHGYVFVARAVTPH